MLFVVGIARIAELDLIRRIEIMQRMQPIMFRSHHQRIAAFDEDAAHPLYDGIEAVRIILPVLRRRSARAS